MDASWAPGPQKTKSRQGVEQTREQIPKKKKKRFGMATELRRH